MKPKKAEGVTDETKVLIGPCGIETRENLRKPFPAEKVLIGPCGIETKIVKGNLCLFTCINWTLRNWNGGCPKNARSLRIVLIGPCGIETSNFLTVHFSLLVLIGPCGIETVQPHVCYLMYSCINWTLRNWNTITMIAAITVISINWTLWN